MDLRTNLAGRLRNTSLPTSNGLLPLIEAIVNSIHSTEDAVQATGDGFIEVHILRSSQAALELEQHAKRPGPDALSEIVGFDVVDNGLGFTDENMKSFLTLDSEYKAERGGRGVGRLLWLKAFDRVRVDSVFTDDNERSMRRAFVFDPILGVVEEDVRTASGESRRTKVSLVGFKDKYRDKTPKTVEVISKNLLEHCLWYFLRPGGCPAIKVFDGNEEVSLDEVYEEYVLDKVVPESVNLAEGGEKLDLLHVMTSPLLTRSHSIAYCADSRLVFKENLAGKIPGLYGPLTGPDGDFIYECYVSSPLLDSSVRAERTQFDVDSDQMSLFGSPGEVREAVMEHAKVFLEKYMEELRERSRQRIRTFVETKGPRYRPIIKRISEDDLIVDPAITDRELDVLLHRHLAGIEQRMLGEGHDLMHPRQHENFPDYRDRLARISHHAEY